MTDFARRHIGPDAAETARMAATIGVPSLDALVDDTVPKGIRLQRPLDLPAGLSEHELAKKVDRLARQNRVFRSFIGQGYADTFTPPVILRNILENPGWYTAYTPYQAEIAQGRLEALLNFQTMVVDLTGMEIAGASLLDEGTAAAEAMAMIARVQGESAPRRFLVAADCHPQTIAVVQGRAEPIGIEIVVADAHRFDFAATPVMGALVQYPATDGAVVDLRPFVDKAKAAGAMVVVAADILSLALLTPPGEIGADVAVGSTQRFGVPMGYGGPHAAYLATRTKLARSMPGRLIGVSQDAHGQPALRMALQTREQHIRREKATSNVCTAQVLLAVVASMYAVWHGPDGVRAIAERVHGLTKDLARRLSANGFAVRHAAFFDTIRVDASKAEQDAIVAAAEKRDMNLRRYADGSLGVALDETTTPEDVDDVVAAFGASTRRAAAPATFALPAATTRTTTYLTHPVFSAHRTETEMLRYLKRLENKDLSLAHSMIPLGSCTMKLNATSEMQPVTDRRWGGLHPFAPAEQAKGYTAMFGELERALAEITGFAAVSLQPNAGSQGELAGMLVIRRFHEARGQGGRDVVLIPQSAHGTNPATAVMAGYEVVVVGTDVHGNIDVADLKAKVAQHAPKLAALMVTYPSTHGVFEEDIKAICAAVHDAGGQVYMDGANMNAQVGLCRPGDIGADVCHLNLHKTFCIPHGGGGPGMGPICVASHLAPFLPTHPDVVVGGAQGIAPISAAPWGSASILLISWAYVQMMGGDGLTAATRAAILNANYVAARLAAHYPVLYRGKRGRVAHECILDLRPLKASAGVEAEDVAKRLMDYGFHAPTMSFPVPGTLMIEPTESEPLEELDRFCEAMIAIREEIAEIERGAQPREGNVLKSAPHTAASLLVDEWTKPYTREKAAYPLAWVRERKFWPSVGRLNNVLGDRNLVCACPPVSAYA